MRLLPLLAIMILSTISGEAQIIHPLFKNSPAVDDIYVRVYYFQTNATNLSVNEKINFNVLNRKDSTATIYFPKPEYICRMQLLDTNGLIVPKTSLGKKFGEEFDELEDYSWDAVNKRGHNTGGTDRPDMGIAKLESGTGSDFPEVRQLFKVNESESYRLSLEFKFFKLTESGTNHTFKVIRLPLFEIPVGK